jgi:protein tyrosine phosphatase
MTENGIEQRFFSHYHYLSWPDHGVPTDNGKSMLEMMEAVNKEAMENNLQDSTQLVHCRLFPL